MSTALVPVAAAECRRTAARANGRPSADFLAQLIAMAGKAPQTRQRRRAAPREAIAAYRACGESVMLSGCKLLRSL